MSERYHFIGIGGIGMGTLASLLLAKGCSVSGSDLKENAMVIQLREQGADIHTPHDAQWVDGADYVIFSSAVPDSNPELVAAQKKKLQIMRRAELLAFLMKDQIGITVAGAHGKTTTTSLISSMLIHAGLHPTTAVGGIVKGVDNHATLGDGRYFVAEADESDGSFLNFHPRYSIVTNLDREHLDHYKNWDNILDTYRIYLNQTDPCGCIIACGDDEQLMNVVKDVKRNYVTYGLVEGHDVWADNIRTQGCLTRFDCRTKERSLGPVQLILPGMHNVRNALAAISLGQMLSIDFKVIEASLRMHQGVNRRFQIKGRINDIVVVDDYGHHPTEIAATLQAAKAFDKQRVITVFQPHRYSRVAALMDDFVKVLGESDEVIITEVYAASETPIPGVTGEELCRRIQKEGRAQTSYSPLAKAADQLIDQLRPGDLVLVLGAGDITRLSDELVERLSGIYASDPVSPSEKF